MIGEPLSFGLVQRGSNLRGFPVVFGTSTFAASGIHKKRDKSDRNKHKNKCTLRIKNKNILRNKDA